jgi:hypothetical protein
LAVVAPAAELYVHQSGWAESLLASRAALDRAGLSAPERAKTVEEVWLRTKEDFPAQWDWVKTAALNSRAGFNRLTPRALSGG